jgi:glycosyltransferase involved in cell wall biosynthesis
MKNICFLLASVEPGGTENYLLRFINYYSKELNRPLVICKSGKDGALKDHYIRAGAVIKVLEPGYFNIVSLFRFFKLIRKNKINVVCDLTGNFSATYILVSRLGLIKKRIVFYRRSSNAFVDTYLNRIVNHIFNYIVVKNSTKILANSYTGLNFFFPNRKNIDNKYKVIYNAIEKNKLIFNTPKTSIKEELGLPENSFIIGHTGRFDKAKNHATIIKIAEKIITQFNHVYFLFCGQNTDNLLTLTHSNEVKNKLILLGQRTDIEIILKEIDLFLFPSFTEGQPNALIEAMMIGLPFIASNIPSIMEIVPKKNHKQLIDPLNIPGFYNLINEVITKPELMSKMKCQTHAERLFSAEINFKLFLDEL